jgi:hypothetical protein
MKNKCVSTFQNKENRRENMRNIPIEDWPPVIFLRGIACWRRKTSSRSTDWTKKGVPRNRPHRSERRPQGPKRAHRTTAASFKLYTFPPLYPPSYRSSSTQHPVSCPPSSPLVICCCFHTTVYPRLSPNIPILFLFYLSTYPSVCICILVISREHCILEESGCKSIYLTYL